VRSAWSESMTTGQVLILFAGVCLAWLAVLIVWSR
jgi:hypothetical protein